jgi:DNA-binding transcriptional MerR regulator
MKVSELAQSLEITPDTVRYYTRAGFLTPKKNNENGYKDYSLQDKKRLRFIVNARQIGFSVKDIQQILQHAQDDDSACPMVRKLIEERLQQTEVQFQQIKTLRNKMRDAVEQWQALPDQTSSNEIICHLIESFTQQSDMRQKPKN